MATQKPQITWMCLAELPEGGVDVTRCCALPEPGAGKEEGLALIVLIWEGRLIAVVLAAFRRCFSAPESARLFMFSHGGPCAMLILSFPPCTRAGCLGAQMEQRCCPAAPLLRCKLLPGKSLDPAWDPWILPGMPGSLQ